jgi:hypothetical protein
MVYGLWFMVYDSLVMVYCFEFRVWDFRLIIFVRGVRLRVQSLGFARRDLGFRI